MLESMRLLGDAMESLHQPISPQMAVGVAATENAWFDMEAEFGLLEGPEVARLAGSKQTRGHLLMLGGQPAKRACGSP